MMTRRRVLKALILLLTLAVVSCGVGGYLLKRMIEAPLYRPGMVREQTNLSGPLSPPVQNNPPNKWQVEPDVQLHFQSRGQGRPVLVLHGGPGFPYDEPWQGLESLTDRHRFYYYHQRGCGESTRPFDKFATGGFYANMRQLEQQLGLGAQIADIERIRRILDEDQLILVGHSFGGFLATLYAAEFPEHVERLVLVAPADVLVLPHPEHELQDRIRAALPESDRVAFDEIAHQYFDFGGIFKRNEEELAELQRDFGRYFLQALGEPMTHLEGSVANGGWMVFAMYFSMGQRHDYRAALQSIEAPVLIVHGADDRLSRHGSESYRDALPRARFHLVASESGTRAGHFVFHDQPEKFAQVVGDFLGANEHTSP